MLISPRLSPLSRKGLESLPWSLVLRQNSKVNLFTTEAPPPPPHQSKGRVGCGGPWSLKICVIHVTPTTKDKWLRLLCPPLRELSGIMSFGNHNQTSSSRVEANAQLYVSCVCVSESWVLGKCHLKGERRGGGGVIWWIYGVWDSDWNAERGFKVGRFKGKGVILGRENV